MSHDGAAVAVSTTGGVTGGGAPKTSRARRATSMLSTRAESVRMESARAESARNRSIRIDSARTESATRRTSAAAAIESLYALAADATRADVVWGFGPPAQALRTSAPAGNRNRAALITSVGLKTFMIPPPLL